MKRISVYRKLMVLAGCVSFVCAANVGVSFAASASSTATAKAIAPIAIAADTNHVLNFGTFIEKTAGSIALTAVDTTVASPTGVTIVANTAKSGKFDVSGEAGQFYTVNIADASLTGGGSPITLSSFVTNGTPALTGSSTPVTLYVGATATIPADAQGAYSGNYSCGSELLAGSCLALHQAGG